jgi:hypothetical protein
VSAPSHPLRHAGSSAPRRRASTPLCCAGASASAPRRHLRPAVPTSPHPPRATASASTPLGRVSAFAPLLHMTTPVPLPPPPDTSSTPPPERPPRRRSASCPCPPRGRVAKSGVEPHGAGRSHSFVALRGQKSSRAGFTGLRSRSWGQNNPLTGLRLEPLPERVLEPSQRGSKLQLIL